MTIFKTQCYKCGKSIDMSEQIAHGAVYLCKECYAGNKEHDPVNHPKHYTVHPSGVECIQITEYMGFNLGNAIKYIWRADLKNGLEDLKKAAWYINREIEKRSK